MTSRQGLPNTPDELTAVQTVVDAVDPAQTLTGLPLVNRELSKRFLPQFLKGLAIGTIMVLISLVLVFRDWRLCALALLPTLAGLVWTAGALALAGVELDLFAVFAVVTFVASALITHSHGASLSRAARRSGANGIGAAPVILAAAAITLFGYGRSSPRRIPIATSIGVVWRRVCALALASVILLPALMMSSGDVRTAALIPAHNEAATIADVVRGVRPFVSRVLVVDERIELMGRRTRLERPARTSWSMTASGQSVRAAVCAPGWRTS